MFEEEEGAIDTGDAPGMGNVPPARDAAPQQTAGAIDTAEDAPGMGNVPPSAPVGGGKPRIAADDIVDAGKETPLEGIKKFPGNVKRIVSYLMGEGADDPSMLDRAGASVDPRGSMSADERNVLAVDAAAKQGGPEAAWKLVQANRVAYNAKQAFAYAAINGTGQKPPDINAAIDAANQASTHVLDGSQVKFAPSQGGVTATVTQAGGQPQQIQLSPDAFRRYLNVGGEGQWDRVMSGGVPATLQKLSQGGSAGITRLDQAQPMPNARSRQAPAEPTESEQFDPSLPAPAKTNFGKTPSTVNLSGSDEVRQPNPSSDTNYGAELEARALRMFPGITQEQERNQWMATQEQRGEEMQNKIDVAGETGKRKLDVARATGASRVEAATVTGDKKNEGWKYASDAKRATGLAAMDQRIKEMQSKNANAQMIETGKTLRAKMATLQTLTPQEEEYVKGLVPAANEAHGVTKPGAQPQQQAAPQQKPQGQPPVPGSKFFNGKWYTRGPNGESVPVQ